MHMHMHMSQVTAYFRATGDVGLLRHALPLLDREYDFWMSTSDPGLDKLGPREPPARATRHHEGHAVKLADRHGEIHVLNKFMSREATPRPESYREDLELVLDLPRDEAARVWCSECLVHRAHPIAPCTCTSPPRSLRPLPCAARPPPPSLPLPLPPSPADIRAAAESGWDFSSRWMEDGATLQSTRTRDIVPVGLNAIMLRFESNMAALYAALAKEDLASGADLAYLVGRYTTARERRRAAMQALLWDADAALWRDYDTVRGAQIPGGPTAASWLPIWAECVPPGSDEVERSISALEASGLLQSAGVLTTAAQTGQQWDAPNAWPPLQHMLIAGLERSGTHRGRELAQVLAAVWVGSNFVSWRRSGYMHEKYDAHAIGESGGGGEYTPQTGFGWTNGVILKLLDTCARARSRSRARRRPLPPCMCMAPSPSIHVHGALSLHACASPGPSLRSPIST